MIVQCKGLGPKMFSALVMYRTVCLLVTLSAFSDGMTYQECLVNTHVANTVCPQPTVNDDVYCLTNKTRITGSCSFLKYFCSEQYFHHRPVHATLCGGPHYNPRPTTTHRPLSKEETTLYAAFIDGIDERLNKARHLPNTTDTIHIFSKQDHTHKNYIRNKNCWAHDLDLTCISPWNSNGHNRKAGVLLSPRHAVWARHYNIKLNSTLRFVDQFNNVVDRKVIKSHVLPIPSTVHGRGFLHGYDMVVGLLNSDVPSTISFAKVLPHNITTLIPYQSHVNLPVLSTDFEEKALIDDLFYIRTTMVGLRRPVSELRLPYYESKITGDSGNPSFFVIDNQLVFLFVFTYGGSGSGTSVQYHHDNINTIMKQLGGGYQLTEIDLSKYIADEKITQIFG